FALTFVTLVVLCAILYLRMGRYEKYLRDLEGIQTLNERLKSLVEGLEGLRTRRVEDRLASIQDVLEGIRDGLGRVRSVDLPAAPKPSLLDLVEAKIYDLGYTKVKVVTDLSRASSVEPLRVVVEAQKNDTTHKGHLILHGSSVVELDLQPVYTSFP
ncbi:MAG: hypothetical protein ACE5F1_18470, partial [Planctomycetota bacterium]